MISLEECKSKYTYEDLHFVLMHKDKKIEELERLTNNMKEEIEKLKTSKLRVKLEREKFESDFKKQYDAKENKRLKNNIYRLKSRIKNLEEDLEDALR